MLPTEASSLIFGALAAGFLAGFVGVGRATSVLFFLAVDGWLLVVFGLGLCGSGTERVAGLLSIVGVMISCVSLA